jgi:hypothetical protein
MKPFPPLTAVFAASLLLAHGEQQPALLTDPSDGSEALTPEVRAIFAPAVVLETTVTRQDERDIIVQRLALDPEDPIEPVITALPVAMLAEPVTIVNEQIAPETTPDLPYETPVSNPNSMIPAEENALLDASQILFADETANPAAADTEPEHNTQASESEVDSAGEEEYETEDEEAPSQPKDLIIRYRIAETPLPTTPAEGSAP